MFLANIQHETAISTYNSTVPAKSGGGYVVVTPPLYIDLFVLFYANFLNNNYREGLGIISRTISFFQQNPWFTHANLPDLDPIIDKLTLEMTNLDVTDLNYLMGLMGTKYLPSVYYKNSDGRCPDFRVYPTAATRLLMATLGLLLKDEGIGFSVLYDMNRAENLFNFLRHQAERGFQVPEVTGVWTRLSFALSLRNPYFINFTAIPVDTEPTKLNFYFSNQEAHVGPDGEVILNQGKWVVADERLPVIPTQYQVLVSDRVMAVQVNAISGVEVITEPRCSSHVHSFDNNFDKADIGVSSPPLFCSEIVYLNFSLLPEDKYTIEKIGYDGKPVEEPRPVLYTAPYPTPLCFIDLLFTDPLIEPGAPPSPSRAEGIYPVRDLWGINPSVVPVDYHLAFRRRRTIWNYYIAPQPASE